MTQKQQIMKALKEGKELSSMDGLKMGIVRLTNRVNELRHRGVPIEDKWETSKEGARYKVYFIRPL